MASKELHNPGCFPCIDGKLVVGSGVELLKKKKQHKIPYMIGSTSHDVVPPFLYSMGKTWCKKQEKPSYLWFFERNLPGDDHGAWHSSDLWYWFGTLENSWRPFEEKDYALSEEMSDRLCAFAKTASPNLSGYTDWEPCGKTAFTFGDSPTARTKPSSLKLWITMFTNEAPGE